MRSEEINEYLKRGLGEEFSAKDFRTWNATVLAAVSLATDGRGADSKTARKRAIDRSVRAVAELLGNTPAVARRSYIDPRVFDRYLSGWTIAGALDRLGRLDPANDRHRARSSAPCSTCSRTTATRLRCSGTDRPPPSRWATTEPARRSAIECRARW